MLCDYTRVCFHWHVFIVSLLKEVKVRLMKDCKKIFLELIKGMQQVLDSGDRKTNQDKCLSVVRKFLKDRHR